MMTPEAKIKKEIREYIDSLPNTFRIPTITRGYGKSGIPDDTVCYQGFFIAPEIKAIGKHTTPIQDLRMSEIIKAGGVTGICWRLEDAIRLFKSGEGWVATDIGSKKYEIVRFQH